MNRNLIVTVSFLLLCGAAFAQTPTSEAPQQPPASNPEASTPEPSPSPSPAAAEPAAPGASTPSTAPAAATEEGGLLQQKLDALAAQLTDSEETLEALKRLKLSGYVQGRYQYADNSEQGLNASGSPLVRDGFTVRRGRLKVAYTTDVAGFMLQIDATPRGVTLKDAEARLIEPWTGQKLELVVGQTKWPFGFEVLQSSSEREFPERTRVVRAFAAGERDRGAKLVAKAGLFRFSGGVFDGNGTENRPFLGVDNDQNKDVVGRLGVDLKWLSGGISGWWGRTYNPGELQGSARVGAGTHDRNRLGADLQLQGTLLPIGKTILRAEYITGRTWMRDGVEQFGVPASGWYAVLVQSLGARNAVALRYDYFDPESGRAPGASSSDPTAPSSANPVGTAGIALIHHWDESLRLTAAYEVPMTQSPAGVTDPQDNLLTLQLQAKF